MVRKVVLINSACGIYPVTDIGPGDQHLGLLTIREGLRFKGFGDVSLFPQAQTAATPPRIMTDGLEGIVGEASGEDVIFGITAMTEVYYNFVELSSRIRDKFPRALIIGGGPHFRREQWNNHRDSIRVALEDGLIDGAVQGHAQPFIELVTRFGGDLDAAKGVPGLYALDSSGEVVGCGAGESPRIGQMPFISYKIKLLTGGYGDVVHMLFKDSCANNCDFCCVNKSGNGITMDLAKAALEKAFSGTESAYLVLEDSNPFEPKKISFYEEIFDSLGSKNSRIMKTGFVDPSLLADDAYSPRLLDFFFRHNFRKFFIGRDCVTEEDAQTVGTRRSGKIRSQHQLDQEKEGITRFIHQLEDNNSQRASNGLPSRHYQIKISYIVSPFGSEEAHLKMFAEMEEFERMSSDSLQIFPRHFVLAPFPGTRLKQKLFGHIADPELFESHNINSNAWRASGPGSLLLDKLIKLDQTNPNLGKNRYDLLRQAVKMAYARK